MMLLFPIRRFTLVCLTILMSTAVSAQIRLALWGGVHSSSLTETNQLPGFDTSAGNYFSSRTGFQLGVLAEIPLGKNNIFLQPGLMYSAQGNQFERQYDTLFHGDTLYAQHDLNLNYVEIPLYLTWKLPLTRNGKNHVYLSAGPYFAFMISATRTYQERIRPYGSDDYQYRSDKERLSVGDGSGQFNLLDIGIATKAGFELGNVMIGAYFSRGFSNAYNAAYPSSFHNQVFGGSVAVWLNSVKPAPKPVTDTDQDGTLDPDDSCKTIAGVPAYHGCPVPDTDHDGVDDLLDSCRLTAGPARLHGCPVPDTDGDGVNDESDSCRTVSGLAKYHGCPIPDMDSDGVNDETDRCPDKAGPADNHGCPVLPPAIQARAQIAAASILFGINSATLKPVSYPAISEIADSLRAHPDLGLLIEGNTDNTGNPEYNRQLSLDRAQALKNALLQRGIPENRIEVAGYGDTRPIADNKTVQGRAKNRRVAFVFHINNR